LWARRGRVIDAPSSCFTRLVMPAFEGLPDLSDLDPTHVPVPGIVDETMDDWRERKTDESQEIAHSLDLSPRWKKAEAGKGALQKLNTRHLLMINYFLAGMTQAEVCELMGMTKCGVTIIYNSPFFQQALRDRMDEINAGLDKNVFNTVALAKKRLEEEAFGAAEKLVSLSKSADDKIALAATKDLLDRCFGSTKDKDQSPPLSLSGAQIENLQVIFQESRKVG
jgi:hypothetical protein